MALPDRAPQNDENDVTTMEAKRRTTLLLSALFLSLLGLTVVLLSPRGEREASYDLVKHYLGVDSSNVSMMTIHSGKNDVTFEKVGGEWHITEPLNSKADQNSVLQLLAQTNQLEVKSLVSDNPERQSMFEVDTAGTLLVFSEPIGKVDSLIIGKSGPNFSDRYVRKAGSDEVYLAGGLRAFLYERKPKEWRDKTIVDIPQDVIERVTVTLPKETCVLVKREQHWFVGQDSTDESAVNTFLRALNPLRADDIVDSSVTVPKKPTFQLGIAGSQSAELQFYQTPTDTLKYWAKTSTSTAVYQVSQWSAKRLMKSKKDLTGG